MNTHMTNNGNDTIIGSWISSKVDNNQFKSYMMGFEESLRNYYQYKKNKLKKRDRNS